MTAARRDERSKLHNERMSYRKEEEVRADERAEARKENEITRMNRLRNEAHADCREAKAETRKLERHIRKLEKQLEESSDEEMPECMETDDESDPTRRLPFELMPRRAEDGKFQAEGMEIRGLRWAQLGRGVDPATVSENIADVFALLGMDIPGCTDRQGRMLRGEVTIAGECIAAWKFAKAKRIKFAAGWDESTKFGDAVFACTFVIENFDGTEEETCLRGLSLIPDGTTSEAIRAHIEERHLAHARARLVSWRAWTEKKYGAGKWEEWGGPSPDSIGLHRLAEDTVLMTDTCNGARCTKRLLANSIMQRVQEKVGAAAWNALSEEQRSRKYKCFRGDCHQHLRNIIIGAMAGAGDQHVKGVLADSLEQFSSFERIEPNNNSIIRGCFRQFHDGGEYALGRGRQFKACRETHHRSALFIPFERAVGNRQDLAFDGAVPVMVNRKMCLDFTRGFIDCPKSDNVLDKSLYTVLGCNEFVALTRANSLWKVKFSEPYRWLRSWQDRQAQGLVAVQNERRPRSHRGRDAQDCRGSQGAAGFEFRHLCR